MNSDVVKMRRLKLFAGDGNRYTFIDEWRENFLFLIGVHFWIKIKFGIIVRNIVGRRIT